MLLRKEAAAGDVERVLKSGESYVPSRSPSHPNENVAAAARSAYDIARTGCAQAKIRTQGTLEHMRILQDEMNNIGADTGRRRVVVVRRKAELDRARREMREVEEQSLPSLNKSILKVQTRTEALHEKTVKARAYMCREAAKALGLVLRRRAGSREKDVITIGKMPVVDLRELYSMCNANR